MSDLGVKSCDLPITDLKCAQNILNYILDYVRVGFDLVLGMGLGLSLVLGIDQGLSLAWPENKSRPKLF